MRKIFGAQDLQLFRIVVFNINIFQIPKGRRPIFHRTQSARAESATERCSDLQHRHGLFWKTLLCHEGSQRAHAAVDHQAPVFRETIATFTRQRLLKIFIKVCDAMAIADSKSHPHTMT